MMLSEEHPYLQNEEWVAALTEQGIYNNETPGRFTSVHGVQPGEVCELFEEAGFVTQTLLGLQGLSVGVEASLHEMSQNEPAIYEKVLGILEETATDPSIHGMSGHLLYVGLKKA